MYMYVHVFQVFRYRPFHLHRLLKSWWRSMWWKWIDRLFVCYLLKTTVTEEIWYTGIIKNQFKKQTSIVLNSKGQRQFNHRMFSPFGRFGAGLAYIIIPRFIYSTVYFVNGVLCFLRGMFRFMNCTVLLTIGCASCAIWFVFLNATVRFVLKVKLHVSGSVFDLEIG